MKSARNTARILALATAVTLGFTAGAAHTAPGKPHPGVGKKYHVDCSKKKNGAGSEKSPYTSLAQASAATFGPGDQLLFKRGVTCVGTLTTSGKGTADAPFTIGSYGNPHQRAVLDGQGAATVVRIVDSEHVVIDGLEITNPASSANIAQRGITVQLQDTGVRSGFTIRNTYIHDVLGTDLKGPSGSQGIAFQVLGSTVPTTFDDVQILDNRMDNINRQGINVQLSTWSCRAEISCAGTPNWLGATNVVVRGNHLTRIGGDGMVLNTTEGALAERNLIEGFNERSLGYNAGLWTYNSNNFVAQYNNVSGGVGTRDSMAYDIDGGSLGATFQYNLSHENDGGFFLFCPINGPVRDATVRYNVSVDDAHRGFENCQNNVESAEVYNNTLHIGDGIEQVVINEGQVGLRNVNFTNNIVHKVGSGRVTFAADAATGYRFANNIFSGPIVNRPTTHPGGSTADPQFCAPGPVVTFADAAKFLLRAGSPALDAGVPVDTYSGMDYFGAPVTNPPSIGAGEVAGC